MIKYQYQEINTFERSFSFLVLFHLECDGIQFLCEEEEKKEWKTRIGFQSDLGLDTLLGYGG